MASEKSLSVLVCMLLSTILIWMIDVHSNVLDSPPYILCSILPHAYLIMGNMNTDTISAVALTLIWSIYMNIIFAPFYLLLGKWIILSIYLPLFVVFAKKVHQPPSWLYLKLQTLIWDTPLFLWMRICHSALGTRALPPLASVITDDLVIGSAPFSSDVAILWDATTLNVGAVVNLCRYAYMHIKSAYDYCSAVCFDAEKRKNSQSFTPTESAFLHLLPF